MRKTTMVTIGVLAALGVAAWVFLAAPLSSDVGKVRKLSTLFMEDLQFKDFRNSSLYHHKLEKDRVDIGHSLEKLFLIKPEFLDIREYRIVKAELDSSGDRARVHFKTKFKRLNLKKEPEEGEVILYWIKRHPDCPIGAQCARGTCVNERNEKLFPLDLTGEEKADVKEDGEEPPAALSCDPAAAAAWFMNLDSTLKEKKYNY